MGYFSNGDEGMFYEERYCQRCVHFGDPVEGPGCPVWFIHFNWNYDQLKDGQEVVKQIMDLLIPRSDDGPGNEQCSMFVEDANQNATLPLEAADG